MVTSTLWTGWFAMITVTYLPLFVKKEKVSEPLLHRGVGSGRGLTKACSRQGKPETLGVGEIL